MNLSLIDVRSSLIYGGSNSNTITFITRSVQVLTYINLVLYLNSKSNLRIIYIFNCLFNSLFVGYSTMSRGQMVILWLITIINLILKEKKSFKLYIFLFSFLGLAFSYFYIDLIRSNITVNDINSFTNIIIERANTLLTLYFLGPTITAANAITNITDNTYGLYTFGGLIRLITSTFSNNELFDIYLRFDVDTGKGTLNSFSYYYYIVSDFGIVFGSVVVYFFGLFCGYVQKKINRNTSNLGYKLFFFITIILIICTPEI